ncbi:MAG: hypothetical protein H6553_14005 [Chitinophagales bacterium]|nr:hypothetical protein [Chitinophagales bacterium]
MKKYFFLLISLSLLLVVSCKKDSINDANNSDCTDGSVNFPYLGVGHELRYIYSDWTSGADSMIVKNESMPSVGTYQSTLTYKPGSSSTIYYHACGKDLYTSLDGNYNQYSHWWISLDAQVGDTWTRTLNGTVYSYELFSKNATVTTLSLENTYTNCYKYTFQSSTSLFGPDTIYFKPDIGVVYYDGVTAWYELASKNF